MIILDVGDDFLHLLLAYRLVERRRCKCGREVFDKPHASLHDHRSGPSRCDACHDLGYGVDPCPACHAWANDAAENTMIDLLMEEAS